MSQVTIKYSQQREQKLEHVLSTLKEDSIENVAAMREALHLRNLFLAQSLAKEGVISESLYLSQLKQEETNPVVVRKQTLLLPPSKPTPTRDPQLQKLEEQFRSYVQQKKDKQLASTTLKWRPDFQRYECTSPNRQRQLAPSHVTLKYWQPQSRNPQADLQSEVKLRQTLIDKIFKELQKDGYVAKTDLIALTSSKPALLRLFASSAEEIKKLVIKYPTSIYDRFSREEFANFLNHDCAPRTQKQETKLRLEDEIRKQKGGEVAEEDADLLRQGCLLKRAELRVIEQVFKELDKFNDLVVRRDLLVKRLQEDPRLEFLAGKAVVYQYRINKPILFERVLERIELEGSMKRVGSEELKVRSFISLQQLLKHFTTVSAEETWQLRQSNYLEAIAQINELSAKEIELPNVVAQTFSAAAAACKSVGPYFRVAEFVDQVKSQNQYYQFRHLMARKSSQFIQLEGEDIQDVLNRMLKESQQFIQFSQVLEYFGRKGRPLKADIVPKEVRLSIAVPEQEPVVAYDSDPQYRDQKEQSEGSEDPQQLRETVVKPLGKVTVPKPFNFNQTIKKKKIERSHSINESAFVFRARPIPPKVKQVGLYQKLMQSDEDRKNELKRQAMALTLAREKPFFFHRREKTRKKTKDQRKAYAFRAKPVPWFCSVDLFKKMVEEDSLLRKEKISRMAQLGMSKSRLPPRMEKAEQQKKAKLLREGTDFSKEVAKSSRRRVWMRSEVPDFASIHQNLVKQLELNRNTRRPTEPVPFQFAETSRRRMEKAEDGQAKVCRVQSMESVRERMY